MRPQRVLIYRLGSIGDTIVALPSLHLIVHAFPDAERWMLTNFSVSSKAAPMSEVLNGTGLVHGYLEYPIGVRDPRGLLRLRREIRRLRPEALVYMAASRGRLKALRDVAFFRGCGIRRVIGVPYTGGNQEPLQASEARYEYEGARLLRCLRGLGEVRLDDPAAFDLRLSDSERARARDVLGPGMGGRPLVAASVGAKVEVKDWGDTNWAALLERLGQVLPGAALVLLGAPVERQRSEALLRHWPGVGVNLCGRLSVRESAAMLEQARVFIGHDSGPMHLAAAVGTPCVAIFSSRNLPGEWFPYGQMHRVLYRPIECQGCKLEVCTERQKACINSITVDEVLAALHGVLGTHETENRQGVSRMVEA